MSVCHWVLRQFTVPVALLRLAALSWRIAFNCIIRRLRIEPYVKLLLLLTPPRTEH